MAELRDQQQEPTTFPFKRKPDDPNSQETPNKASKLSALDHNNNNNNQTQEPNPNSKNHTDSEPLLTKEKTEPDADAVHEEAQNDGGELQNDVVDNDDNDDDDDDDDEEEDEEDNGEGEVDRKGKGILRDDKGKGKLVVEEDDDEDEDDDDDDDDDSDDDDDDDVDGSVDSDFSDDPLAEVDLNNILPSRTRRRTVHPGLHIAGDAGKVAAAGDDDNDNDDNDA